MVYYKKKYAAKVIERAPRFEPSQGWTPQFEACFDAAVNSDDNFVISAVAGSGKTTAIVEICYQYKEANPYDSILYIAFNSHVREEAKSRVPFGVDVETCHSFNFKPLIREWGNGSNQFDIQGSTGAYPMSLAAAAIGPEEEKLDDRLVLCQAVSMAKTRLANNTNEIIEMMDQFGIEPTYTQKEFAKHILWMLKEMMKGPGTTTIKMKGGKSFTKKAITYDDQVWIPIIKRFAPAKLYDLVIVDEGQDLSPARKKVAMNAMKEDGRIMVALDPLQGIYSFAGADINASDDIIKSIKAKLLPLTCSFRCAKNIIKEAQKYNTDIEWAPGAIDGIVRTIHKNDLTGEAKPGDVILSRTNAPLVKLFFSLAKSGKKVSMLGKDFGSMIAYRIRGWKKEAKKNKEKFTLDSLLEKNDEWLDEKLKLAKEKKFGTGRIEDEYEVVVSLAEDTVDKRNTEKAADEVLERLQAMFSEDETPGNDKNINCVTLSSTHKFKGLERDKVYILNNTYRPGEGGQELNLMYIAITRAKKELVYVVNKD